MCNAYSVTFLHVSDMRDHINGVHLQKINMKKCECDKCNGGSSQLTARYTRTHLYPIAIYWVRLKGSYVVARIFFLLLLNCSAWPCLGPA